MITSLEISGFRGIREGKLENLTPLVILVGPNGCGKSTVLDALRIGASDLQDANQGAQEVLKRHRGLQQSARWITWKGDTRTVPRLRTWEGNQEYHSYDLIVSGQQMVHCQPHEETGTRQQRVVQLGRPERPAGPSKSTPVRLLETLALSTAPPLHQLVTAAYKDGRRSEIAQMISEVVPKVTEVLILTEGDAPVVHLEYPDHTVPATLAGDGIHSLLRICLELTASPNGLILVEEPENHQHPAAMRQSVRAILSAVRHGTQVVLTTHSLELIDVVLAESSEEDLQRLSLYHLDLANGKLVSVRSSGAEVAFARGDIERDLR